MIMEQTHPSSSHGLPEIWDRDTPPPGITRTGHGLRMADSVTCYHVGSAYGRGIVLGDGVVIFNHVRLVVGDININPDAGILIGNHVWINAGAYLSGEGGLDIDDEVLIGPGAKILSAGHEIDGLPGPVIDHGLTYGRIRICKGAWVAAGACVLQGVEIGEGAVVGAGSVVTKDIMPFSVVAGNPARFIRWRKGFEPAKDDKQRKNVPFIRWIIRNILKKTS